MVSGSRCKHLTSDLSKKGTQKGHPGKKGKLEFFGSSSSSPRLPVALIRGTLSTKGSLFKDLQKCCKDELNRAFRADQYGGSGWGESFRATTKIPVKRANGISCHKLAPLGVRKFVARIRAQNMKLFRALDAEKHRSYVHGKTQAGRPKQVRALEASAHDALFSYVTINQWPDGVAQDPWHVDGGPSMVFLAVTLSGQRIVEIEDADGKRSQLHMREGDWYMSSPSCFWHRVLPVQGSSDPAETLLLRSAMLSKRLSGGRDRGDGTRTPGFIYGTKQCFEDLAAQVAKHLAKDGFRI